MDWTQAEMFDIPQKYRPPKAPDNWPKWRTYRGKRISCDDCIISIATGQRRFISEAAKFVRQDAERTSFYCTRHAVERKQQDGL